VKSPRALLSIELKPHFNAARAK